MEEKTLLHMKNILNLRTIILLTISFVIEFFFAIAFYQFFKKDYNFIFKIENSRVVENIFPKEKS